MVADVMDALYDQWTADATLTGLGVVVRDGDEPTDGTATRELWVGGTGTDDDDTDVATSQREWAHASTASDIDEWVSVTCTLWAWSGDVDSRGQRRAAINLLNAAVAVVRGSTLGLAPRVLWTEVPTYSLRQIQDERGSACVVTFVVRARCRIEPN